MISNESKVAMAAMLLHDVAKKIDSNTLKTIACHVSAIDLKQGPLTEEEGEQLEVIESWETWPEHLEERMISLLTPSHWRLIIEENKEWIESDVTREQQEARTQENSDV